MTTTSDTFAPDPQGAAERIRERTGEGAEAPSPRRVGRPRGPARTSSSPAAVRARRYRANKKARGDDDTDTDDKQMEPYAPDDARIAAFAHLGRTVWQLAGKFMGYRALTDEEAAQLGAAMDPVAHKYMGFLTNYADELNLALVVFTLSQSTKAPKEEEPAPDPGVPLADPGA